MNISKNTISNDIEKYKREKLELQNKKLLILQEIKSLQKCKQIITNEKINKKKYNYWTGYRNPNTLENYEHNWTTFICLKYKRSTFPYEVMLLINQYLNWFPAGCWKPINSYVGCRECGFFILDKHFDVNVCSWECYESLLRKNIITEYYNSIWYLLQLNNINDELTYIMCVTNSLYYYDYTLHYDNCMKNEIEEYYYKNMTGLTKIRNLQQQYLNISHIEKYLDKKIKYLK